MKTEIWKTYDNPLINLTSNTEKKAKEMKYEKWKTYDNPPINMIISRGFKNK